MRMKNMKLTKSEQEFIAENITKFDMVTGITVDEIEVRIHGAYLNKDGKQTAIGSAAVYRTKDLSRIWDNTTKNIKEIEANIAAYEARKKVVGSRAWHAAQHDRM